MTSGQIAFAGPAIDDTELLARLPEALVASLRQMNGFVQFGGGLHVRGACKGPAWHSLRAAWEGPMAFQQLYRGVEAIDVPFAEDCMGDQFLLRSGSVFRLAAETGELKQTGLSFVAFVGRAQGEPLEFLQMYPLLQFQREGNVLGSGQLLAAYPPFFAAESGEQVSLKAIPTMDRRAFLADVAAQVRDLPEGATIKLRSCGEREAVQQQDEPVEAGASDGASQVILVLCGHERSMSDCGRGKDVVMKRNRA